MYTLVVVHALLPQRISTHMRKQYIPGFPSPPPLALGNEASSPSGAHVLFRSPYLAIAITCMSSKLTVVSATKYQAVRHRTTCDVRHVTWTQAFLLPCVTVGYRQILFTDDSHYSCQNGDYIDMIMCTVLAMPLHLPVN